MQEWSATTLRPTDHLTSNRGFFISLDWAEKDAFDCVSRGRPGVGKAPECPYVL